MQMEEKREVVRKTVSLDKELVSTSEALYSEAGVDNFTQFTANALQMYTDCLLSKKQSPLLAKEIRKAVKDEVQPIATRLSKGLYRYAILMDMMCQIAACLNFSGDTSILEEFRRNANIRVAKMRGQIDIKSILFLSVWIIHKQFNSTAKRHIGQPLSGPADVFFT